MCADLNDVRSACSSWSSWGELSRTMACLVRAVAVATTVTIVTVSDCGWNCHNHVDGGDFAHSLPAIDCLGSDQGHEALRHPGFSQYKNICIYTYIFYIYTKYIIYDV